MSGQAILATPEAPIVTRRPVADQIVKANAAPLVWLITGQCVGDTNQIRALADALHWPTVDKPLRFNPLRRLPWLRGPRLDTLTRPSRLMIRPPWPDLIIGAGYGGVPVARWIRRQNGGATRIVMFGNPRSAIDDLDLVITTPQYDRAPAPNVLALPLPVGDPAASVRPTADERAWLANLHAPRRLVVVGGPARNWTVDWDELKRAIDIAAARSSSDGGTVIVVTSPRTDLSTTQRLDAYLAPRRIPLVSSRPRFATLLWAAHEIWVTADSVSMIAEAVLTGRPVAMIPARRLLRGRLSLGLSDAGLKPPPRMDLRKFWTLLDRQNLVGPPDSPHASKAPSTIALAVDAVRALF